MLDPQDRSQLAEAITSSTWQILSLYFSLLKKYLFQINHCAMCFPSQAAMLSLVPARKTLYLQDGHQLAALRFTDKCTDLLANTSDEHLLYYLIVFVFVREGERRREREREHNKQCSVQSDEADGNHSLDRQGREEVGEEEMGLAVKSPTHRNNILKPFFKDATAQISAMRKKEKKSRHSNYHGSAS